ncbi:MAG: GDCCVxC domain-containing (seleno)protein [Methylotenera sp.]
MSAIILDAVLTCPHCGHAKTEPMPTDACQWFYACENCHMLLKPAPGDCCVFCSYGSVKCPPMQSQSSCCYSVQQCG